MKLLVQRAQAVKHDFEITPTNVQPIAEICTRLDGLPLALELAAARIRLLSPAALLSRLDRRFEILTGGANDLPERQRTLRATLVWSYELLSARTATLTPPVKARLLGEEGLALCQEVGEPATIVRTLQALAYFAYAQHDYAASWQRFAEGLLPSQALNSRQLLSSCLIGLGVVAQAQGQLDWAARLWGAAAQATKSSSAPESNIYQWQNEFVRHQFDAAPSAWSR